MKKMNMILVFGGIALTNVMDANFICKSKTTSETKFSKLLRGSVNVDEATAKCRQEFGEDFVARMQ